MPYSVEKGRGCRGFMQAPRCRRDPSRVGGPPSRRGAAWPSS
jgi:hypothetical protein